MYNAGTWRYHVLVLVHLSVGRLSIREFQDQAQGLGQTPNCPCTPQAANVFLGNDQFKYEGEYLNLYFWFYFQTANNLCMWRRQYGIKFWRSRLCIPGYEYPRNILSRKRDGQDNHCAYILQLIFSSKLLSTNFMDSVFMQLPVFPNKI